jgi:branched-chain amino acid transport system permease protein
MSARTSTPTGRAIGASSWRRYPEWKINAAILVLLGLVLLVAPFLVSGYQLLQIEMVVLAAAAASGLNIAVGYAGELILSQVTTIGVAAYVSAILSLNHGWSPWCTIIAALPAAVLWQVIVSLPGLRVGGLYLGILSFFTVLVFSAAVEILKASTGGSNGLVGVPPLFMPAPGEKDLRTYAVVVAVLVVSVVLTAQFVTSSWGLRLRTLRDSPRALAACGVSVGRTKLAAYVVSAIPAGFVGWCLAAINQSVTASLFNLSFTIILFAGVMVIKPGSIVGPLIGAALLEGYSQMVGPFSSYNSLGLGLLLAVTVLAFPGGLADIGAVFSRSRVPGTETARGEEGSPKRNIVIEPLRPGPDDSDRTGLRVDGLRRSFGGNVAVDGVSFAVPPGRLVALMGDNGSGKTTIVNVISGALRGHGGSVHVDQRDLYGAAAHRVARDGLTRSFQVPQLVEELTLAENIEVGMLRSLAAAPLTGLLAPWLARQRDRERRSRALVIGQSLGLSLRQLETQAHDAPLGHRRIAEVGRAIATGASVICLDEPCAGLNEEELDDLAAVLKALAHSGRAVLVVEHSISFVLKTFDDVLLMRHGSLTAQWHDISATPPPGEIGEFIGSSAEEAGHE